MNILVLGNHTDEHAAYIAAALTKAGANVNYLDTYLFPTQLQISWQPHLDVGYFKQDSDCVLDLKNIHSVFWRSIAQVSIPKLEDSYQQMVAFNDSMSAIKTLIKACPSRWVNSWDAYEFHKQKPLQLRQVCRLGVKIPPTLITNDTEAVINFTKIYPKTIFKPVYGGAHTRLLTDDYLDSKRLNLALKVAPITLQEYIPGTNIRTYVIGDSVYSAEIRTQCTDFREDETAQIIPVNLPNCVHKQSLAITKALLMEWTAIDWRLTPNGEFVFLEANPSPMFLYFERQTEFPITQQLVRLLITQ